LTPPSIPTVSSGYDIMKMYILRAWTNHDGSIDVSRLQVINRRDCKAGYAPPVDMMEADARVTESNAWAVKTYGTDELEACLCGQHNPSAHPDYSPAEIADAQYDIDHHPDFSPFWDSSRGQESARIALAVKLEPVTSSYFRRTWHSNAMREARGQE
jgi:hypothetical protein